MYVRIWLRKCINVGLMLFAVGCATRAPLSGHPEPTPRTNVVLLDATGAMIDPDTRRPLTLREEKRYVQAILDAADSGPDREFLLFFHGGLNSHEDTIARAKYLTKRIREAGTGRAGLSTGAFPLFIGWNSSLVSSYREHVLYIRQGRRRPVLGPLTAPITFLSDTARALIRLPSVWFAWSDSALQNTALRNDALRRTEPVRNLLAQRYKKCLAPDSSDVAPNSGSQCDEIRYAQSSFRVTERERMTSAAQFAATIPTKLLASPVLDGYGGPAWKIMQRRIDGIFDPTMDARPSKDVTSIGFEERYVGKDTRGLEALFHGVATLMQRDKQWKVALVGHSMGTIIVNNVIHRFETLPISHIVYLAAACSIAEYEDTVFPYLTNHPDTSMYHLVLDRQAEVRDGSFRLRDLAVRGSLLMWIDDFLEDPDSPRDLTAGRELNLLPAAVNTPEAIRSRVHIQVFGVGNAYKGVEPQAHGDFGYLSFWKRGCLWAPPAKFRKLGCYCDPKNPSHELSDIEHEFP
jgi:hypothetical protein